MNRTVYSHPDGFTLAFNDNTLIATDDNGKTVCLPIGRLGLVELAEKLNVIGKDAVPLAEPTGAVNSLLLRIWCTTPSQWPQSWRAAK
jgi:hypothetical protein